MDAIGKGDYSTPNLKAILMNTAVSMEEKELLHYTIVFSVLTYGSEAQTLLECHYGKSIVKGVEMRYLRSAYGVS